MSLKPILDAGTAAANMAEIEPKYTGQEALVEAERCLYCFDAPCINSCPTGIDIPGFIKKIATGNLAGSARTILQANVLGASCARVCPTEVLCEGACVMLDLDHQPIKIGRLQRYATDHVFENQISVLSVPETKSGKRVALIGGGPASLGCAAELAQLGHQAVIFEKNELAGGLNTYGIAYYKLRPETSIAEIEMIRGLGVEIREHTEVGKDVSAETLEKEFDAIFIGVGLGHTYRLDIPGEELPEVREALAFIADIHTEPLHEVPVGRNVAVIGCGNTAIDAVTQAKRLGAAQAVIVYRRGEGDMPAYEYEYELAKSDGCEFLFNAKPVEILHHSGKVTGLRMVETRPGSNGRLEEIPGSEFDKPFDMVIKALGQEKMAPMLQSLFPALELEKNGTVKREFTTGVTNVPHIYAGGDGAGGGSEVVDAVAEGKRAARGMHAAFTGERVEGPVQTTRLGAPGKVTGAGFDGPVRIPELEKAYDESEARRG
jgi:dihydropyrimidine dehydrogenase (NAD+) subunit PreT